VELTCGRPKTGSILGRLPTCKEGWRRRVLYCYVEQYSASSQSEFQKCEVLLGSVLDHRDGFFSIPFTCTSGTGTATMT